MIGNGKRSAEGETWKRTIGLELGVKGRDYKRTSEIS